MRFCFSSIAHLARLHHSCQHVSTLIHRDFKIKSQTVLISEMTVETGSTKKKRAYLGRPRADGKPPITDDDIMRVAEQLFATHGFAGTTLNMIAAELDAKKPSILHRYASKKDILNTLITKHAENHLPVHRRIREQNLSAPVALYKTVWIDTHICASFHNYAQRLYQAPEIRGKEFEAAHRYRSEAMGHYKSLLRAGKKSGQFLYHSVTVTAEAIVAAVDAPMSSYEPEKMGAAEQQATIIADFVLRSILVDRSELSLVKKHARRVHIDYKTSLYDH